jgi:hypothetical protein
LRQVHEVGDRGATLRWWICSPRRAVHLGDVGLAAGDLVSAILIGSCLWRYPKKSR